MTVSEFKLLHASDYYDPVKAHEYYLKTRELKGLSPASTPVAPKKVTPASVEAAKRRETATRQREARAYVKDRISSQKTSEQTAQEAAQQARSESIRKNAEEVKARVMEKLTSAMDKVKAELLGVKLNVIPENATPKLKAFMMRQNQALMLTAQKKAQKDSSAASEEANVAMQKLGTDMKDAVSKARDEYTANKAALASKFKDISAREEQNIIDNVK